MRWTKEQYADYLKAKSITYAAYQTHRSVSSPKPESVVRHESMGTEEGETKYPDRIRVSVVSFRRRFCDPDNLCPKYFVDCLRYAAYIPNDREKDIELKVRQVKVKTGLEERTEITIEPLPS